MAPTTNFLYFFFLFFTKFGLWSIINIKLRLIRQKIKEFYILCQINNILPTDMFNQKFLTVIMLGDAFNQEACSDSADFYDSVGPRCWMVNSERYRTKYTSLRESTLNSDQLYHCSSCGPTYSSVRESRLSHDQFC